MTSPTSSKDAEYAQLRLTIVSEAFQAIVAHAKEGGTFRHLIYDRLGFGPDQYMALEQSGGRVIADNFLLGSAGVESLASPLQTLQELAEKAPMENHATMVRSDGTPLPVPSLLRAQLFDALHTAEDFQHAREMLLAANERLGRLCENLEAELVKQRK